MIINYCATSLQIYYAVLSIIILESNFSTY